MRIIGLALAVAILLSGAASAHDGRWIAPGGAFSLDLASRDWVVVDRNAGSDIYEDEIAIFSPRGDTRADSRCAVQVTSMPMAGRHSRESMNRSTAQLTESSLIVEMRADPNFSNLRVDVGDVNGTATLDVYGQFMRLDIVHRRFFLHSDGILSQYLFACSVPQANTAAVADAHAIAASLQFAH